MNRLRSVVILVPSLGMGGMERVCVNYANLFVRRGYSVTVLNFSYDEPSIVADFSEEVKYIKNYTPVQSVFNSSLRGLFKGKKRFLPWSKWIKFHSPEYLYKKYITEKYDIEIAFFGSESVKILSGSKNKNSFCWIHSVNVESYINALGTLQKAKQAYSDIQKIICVSEHGKDEIERVFGRSKDVFVVNNPNDTGLIRKKSAELTVDTKGVFTFVTVARICDRQKGFMRLLDVCKRLNDEGLKYNVWLVGDGEDYYNVKNRAEELKLPNVKLFGKQGNPYVYIKSADAYLCTSYYEGFSMVMMEAIILGTPMISTEVSGAREMLGDSEYGLVVENSSEGIYEGMKKLITDKELYAHYQKKADERKDYLSEDRIMDQLGGYFE